MKVISNPKILIGIVFSSLMLILLFTQYNKHTEKHPIRIGILHSLSGTMAGSERPLVDILLMTIDEINEKGGVLGRKLEAVVVDSRSDEIYAAREAERLIREEKVKAIFGCWTSACRKAVKNVIEKYNHILFYPVQYEGLEQSNNIIYTGSAPNQQIIPGTIWALKNLGSRIYLLGSDYVFPRTANFIIHDIANAKNAEIVSEQYLPLGSGDFDKIVSEIKQLRPDVILNTINGHGNHSFFLKKHQAGLDDIPVISFSISEEELAKIPNANIESHYAVWSYFQDIDNPVNHNFVNQVKQHLGAEQAIGDPMEASFIGLHLWVQAVQSAESTNPALIYKTIREQSINAPQGIVSIDGRNHHLRKYIRVGQARTNGHFKIIWETEHAVRPVPFPTYRSQSEWEKVVKQIAAEGEN